MNKRIPLLKIFLLALFIELGSGFIFGDNKTDDLFGSLRRADIDMAVSALEDISGPLNKEDKGKVVKAIERLSPGAEWLPFLRNLTEKNNGDPDFLFLLARAHWRIGNVDDAMMACKEAVEKNPQNAGLLYKAAALAHTVDRIEEAKQWVSMLLNQEPNHADGLFLYGRIQASLGQDKEARETLLHVVQQQPRHYLAQYELGRLENRAGNSEKAENHLRAAIHEYPFFNEAYNALLIALARQKKQEDVQKIKSIVNHINTWSQTKRDRLRYAFFNPENLTSKEAILLAYELNEVDRKDLARTFLNRRFEIGKSTEREIVYLAHLHYQNKDFKQCLKFLNRIDDPKIRNSDSFMALKAWSLFLVGKTEESRAYYESIDKKYKSAEHFKELEKALKQADQSDEIQSAAAATKAADSAFVFADVTDQTGLSSFKHVLGHADKPWIIDVMGSGVAVGDYDNDGDDDIYVVNGRSDVYTPNPEETNALFRNDGGTFTDVTQEAGVDDTGIGMSAVFGDINNDGWLDLFVGNYGPNVMYLNNGDGTFKDMTQKAGLGDSGYVAASAFGDVDIDGDLDLFIGNYVEFDPEKHAEVRENYHGLKVFMGPLGFGHQNDILYLNDGTGVFEDISETAAINVSPGRAMGAVFFDKDNDHDLDLYVTNDSTYNHVLQNRGDGTFEDVSFLSGGAFTESGLEGASMGVISGDVNNDGFLDLFITSYEHQSDVLYINQEGKTLVDSTSSWGLMAHTQWLITWGSGFCDFDADGWIDLFTANGHIYPQIEKLDVDRHYAQGVSIYKNIRDRFKDVTDLSLENDFVPKGGRGTALLDYDKDGDMDIVINCIDSSPQLLENRTPRGNWLKVKLDAPPARTYGVRVVAHKDNKTWTRMVDGGSGYLSQNSGELYFGFGSYGEIDDLTVYWMHRSPQVIPNPALNNTKIIHMCE